MKPTELIHLIKIAHDYMVIIAMDKAFEWEKGYGNKLIDEINTAVIPEDKSTDYSYFFGKRKVIWEFDLEYGTSDDLFRSYKELIYTTHRFLVKQPEYTLDELLSQCDSDVEHKDKGWDEMKPVGRELI